MKLQRLQSTENGTSFIPHAISRLLCAERYVLTPVASCANGRLNFRCAIGTPTRFLGDACAGRRIDGAFPVER